MKEKSIGKNALLNMIKTATSLLFPLITYSYVTRILQVENMGKINFSNSLVSYFSLIAILGVKTYATREGAAIRDDRNKFQIFFTEVFSITVVSTIVSYILLFLALISIGYLYPYKYIIIILSASILFTTLGSEWICSVYEDYGYITIRSIAFQVISLILMFALVHDIDDVYQYAVVLVVSSSGANLANCFYVRRYCKYRFTIHMNLKQHLKPIMILFASTLATSIYVSSDTTILGLISGDYYTGLYGVSTKVYSIIKNLISAILVVSIPRFSNYYKNNLREKYNGLLNKISKTLAVLAVPAVVGLFLLSKEIILFLSGEQYILAASSLKILSIAILSVVVSWFLSQCVLIPMGYEAYILKTTIASVLINVGLNICLIPLWNHNATALTTLISESFVALIYIVKAKKLIKISGLFQEIINSAIGSIGIIMGVSLVKLLTDRNSVTLFVSFFVGVVIYFAIMLIIRDKIVLEYLNSIKSRLRRR